VENRDSAAKHAAIIRGVPCAVAFSLGERTGANQTATFYAKQRRPLTRVKVHAPFIAREDGSAMQVDFGFSSYSLHRVSD